MRIDETVRNLPPRPGFRIADYAEVGLPIYKLSTRVYAQAPKKLSAIEEFVLRLVSSGVHRTEEIAAFLGLPVPFIDGTLSSLIAGELLSLTPTSDRTQRLTLTIKGSGFLDGEETLLPEERSLTVEFDALLQKVVRNQPNTLMTGKQCRERGIKQVRPLLKRQIGIGDLPLRDVQKTMSESSFRRDSRRVVLGVCELYKRTLYFLPAVCVIYRAIDGGEIQVSFFVDGSHSPEHDQAFAQADGTRRLHIERDMNRFASELREIESIEREVSQAPEIRKALSSLQGSGENAIMRALKVVPAEVWPSLSASQHTQIESTGLAFLDASDHYPLLRNALKTARFRLVIVSPFLHEQVVTEEFLSDLKALLRRNCKVYIGYGMPDSDTHKPTKSHNKTLESLQKLAGTFRNLFLKKVDSHAKILLQDELFVVLGSFNWLSFRGDPDRAFRDEQSVLISLPSMVELKFQDRVRLLT